MSDGRQVVNADRAPAAVGPYSHAVRSGGLLFCSGQLGLDPESGELAGDSAAEQAAQCLRNLAVVCEAAATGLDRAVRLTVYTTELESFGEINQAYAGFFGDEPPARAVVGASSLPLGAKVEIDAIVALEA